MKQSSHRCHRTWTLLALTLAAVAVGSLPTASAAPPRSREEAGTQWAVLIAVQGHEDRALNLRYTENDVKELRRVLVERAGLSSDRILQMTDGTADRRPTLENIQRELPAFLQRARPEDRVVVFFSGHGCRYKGQTYLVPRDFKRTDPTTSGLPLPLLRESLNRCQAKVKLLILDCCHAADDKNAEATPSAEAVAKAVEAGKSVRNCVVLASCREDEQSVEWDERKQGVFTYWLCRGLEGAAADDTGKVTVSGLNRYIHERVSETVEQLAADRHQTPVQFGKVEGEPVLMTLKPEQPESLCRRLAEHIDLEVRRRKLHKVGVLELTQPLGNTERLAAANLPAYCAEQIRLALNRLGTGSYSVADASVMHQASKDVTIEAVGNPQAMGRLGEQAGGLDAVVSGTLRRRGGNLVVECDLVSTADGNSLVKPSGVFALSEDGMGDQGLSFVNTNRPSGPPTSEKVRRHAEEQSQEGHPLLVADDEKKLPIRFELYTVQAGEGEAITDETPRKKKEWVTREIKDPQTGKPRTELLVGARNGETFEIHIDNNSQQKLAVILLVDGLNTLGQKRERLGNARPWVLAGGKQYVIPGWTFPAARSGEKAIIKRFKFVDMAQSVAGRQKFGESIGLITAGIYGEAGRDIGVGEGVTEERKLETANFRVGPLLGVINIRYVEEKELDKLNR